MEHTLLVLTTLIALLGFVQQPDGLEKQQQANSQQQLEQICKSIKSGEIKNPPAQLAAACQTLEEEAKKNLSTGIAKVLPVNQFVVDPSILTVFVLGTCLACIYMVFFFGRRLQTSVYIRDSLIEGAKQQELRILLRELHDRAMEGPLDPTNAPPETYGPTAQLWEPDKFRSLKMTSSDWGIPGEESDEDKLRREKREEEDRLRQEAARKWESEERARYETLRQQAEKEALERAEKKVPRSIDISLLGGGFAFLLEFSTVIVIIFTLLILGILHTLEGKEISTILAAIAGYVLGKASSGVKQAEAAKQSESSASPVPRS
jgi:hypothetical protein